MKTFLVVLSIVLVLLIAKADSNAGNGSKDHEKAVSKRGNQNKVKKFNVHAPRPIPTSLRQKPPVQHYVMPDPQIVGKVLKTLVQKTHTFTSIPSPFIKRYEQHTRKYDPDMAIWQQQLEESYNNLVNSVDKWLQNYIRENTQGQLNQAIFNISIGILTFLGGPDTKNADLISYDEIVLHKPGKDNSLIEFLIALIRFLDHCKGREEECVQNLAQIMTDEQKKRRAQRRHNNNTRFILAALKEMASRLEHSSDQQNADIALLANAIIQLHDDVEQSENEPTIAHNVDVIRDVYNILNTVQYNYNNHSNNYYSIDNNDNHHTVNNHNNTYYDEYTFLY